MNKAKVKLTFNELKVFNKYLDNPGRMYTGLEVKKYWREKIFKIIGGVKNEAIKAGRWSAYAHYSFVTSGQNIFHKYQLESGSRVLVHPLTDISLIDDLILNGVDLTSLDISKDTLAWRFEDLKISLLTASSKGKLPQLAIISSLAGMGEEIKKAIELFAGYNIPVCLICTENSLNISLLECINTIKNGSVILKHKLEFWPEYVNSKISKIPDSERKNISEFADFQLLLSGQNDVYLSFFIENRATSVLEYHLTDSDQIYIPLLTCLKNIIFKTTNKVDWLGLANRLTDNLVNGNLKIKNPFNFTKTKKTSESLLMLIELWKNSFLLAIPDLVFELSLLHDREVNFQLPKLSELSLDIQNKSRSYHTIFSANVASRPKGTLEVPTFYFNRVYLRYFCYSTEKHWFDEFDKIGVKIKIGYPIHPIFLDRLNLVNVNFVSKYMVLI